MTSLADIESLNTRFETASAQALLAYFLPKYADAIALASSLGAEDQVLTDIVLKLNPKSRIFVLDTGRLHQETYDTMAASSEKYGFTYEVYFPKGDAVQDLVSKKGPNSFYESVENRKECCFIRKVEPLNRALSTCKVWITGLRREQSVTRTDLKKIEWDDTHGIIKLNPLADWTTDQLWQYINAELVPYNKLHATGFPSIGCAPCTRPINAGDDIRAGRWWWETPEQKECGLHLKDGKLVRKNA